MIQPEQKLLVFFMLLLTGLAPSAACDSDASIVAPQPSARIALVIDDLGYQETAVQQLLRMDQQLTLSFLPHAPHSRRLARQAAAAGREIMLHMPMEARGSPRMEQGALYDGMDQAGLQQALRQALQAIPAARGVNNHRGSLLTADPRYMQWLMQELQERGELYFVDSRTSDKTLAETVARQFDVPVTRRRVFLDNDRDPAAVRASLQQLVDDARRRGFSLGIAHPYPETLAVLAQELPRLSGQNVRLVRVSELIEYADARSKNAWHVSSSRSHKVARN